MRRLDSGPRVLDRNAFVGQHRIALPQQTSKPAKSRDETVGLRLAARDVLRRDNVEKQLAESGAVKNRFGLGAQRAGRDHQRKPLRAIARELLGARVENLAIRNHRLIDGGFARDQSRDVLRACVLAILAQDRGETVAIIESDQPREVFVTSDFESFGPDNFVEGREMQRLGVDEGPVEIKYDGTNHVRAKLTRSAWAWKRAWRVLRVNSARIFVLTLGAGVTPAETRTPRVHADRFDLHDRIFLRRQAHRAVLQIFIAQMTYRDDVFLGVFDHAGVSTNQHVRELRPIFFIVIDHDCDARIFRDIVHSLERQAGLTLGFLVDREVDVLAV